ncbi:hypothetical protein PHJA_002406100 [Phtheirospermum japonicum]|uniref:Uncharacterized protein n=1 Tax=Phtheirospermum japonicum TaxID=374723 RepID=A0A830CRW8_9LAMI|nr:hypothetical protein PHJA_002406100 [Phtheirospermum japonicum]
MSDSVNEDREQRKTTGMEESNAMTIEFLRARLLSERSVSKSARQRADELAKRAYASRRASERFSENWLEAGASDPYIWNMHLKMSRRTPRLGYASRNLRRTPQFKCVSELEEQLKFVSLQRKKAEKATADVLAILENHGISDVSEEFDSCSDHDESPRDVKALNSSATVEGTLINTSPLKNEMDAYSSSEIESSPSTGRSLSWRSTKEFQDSHEKKKYMDSVRRRASFASNSLSTRKIGKSCRRIRHRETRPRDELQNDGIENAAYTVDASDGSNAELVALRESSRYENGKNPPASTTVGSNSETQKTNGLHFNVHERDEDMERALRHQAQLIGRYEEEEKAQKAWEEKFRENNSGTQNLAATCLCDIVDAA